MGFISSLSSFVTIRSSFPLIAQSSEVHGFAIIMPPRIDPKRVIDRFADHIGHVFVTPHT